MILTVARQLRQQLSTSIRAAAIVAAGLAWHTPAFALPSCPTLIYEGVSPVASGLIDPGKPTVVFRFNRPLIKESVTGAAVIAERGPTLKPATTVWRNVPKKVFLFDDYGNPVPNEAWADGAQIYVKPMINLAPNKKYRYLVQGVGVPLLADYPDWWSERVCNQPRITYNIAAEYYTRPNATSGCVTAPTPVTTNRYGLIRGCSFNLSYESLGVSNENEGIDDMVWAWANARFVVRGYNSYSNDFFDERGLKVTMQNIRWNGTHWIAQSATATVTGTPATPQSLPEGAIVAQYNNVVVAYSDNILHLQNYILGANANPDLLTAGNVRGSMTLSP